MAVFRQIPIEWDGKTYLVTPDMKLMRSVEMADISLTDIAVRTSLGRPPISHICHVLWRLLKSGGADVSEDDVFEGFMQSDTQGAQYYIKIVLEAFSPSERDEKKAEAPKPARQRKSKAKPSK